MLPSRKPLPEGRPYLICYCLYCGQAFPTHKSGAQYCSARHHQAEYRAVKRLRDTSPPEARA
jgi:hypothetical protein